MTTPPRRLRLVLHAFPRRFRAARSAEIAATFREAELAGDDHVYGARALTDVVRAGWAERLRTHPPLAQYLKYRLLDGRLDPQWHRWMFDDVRGWFGVRRCAWISVPLILLAGILRRTGGVPLDSAFVVMYLAGLVVFSTILTPTYRRRTLRRHGYDPETLLWAPPTVWVDVARRPPRPVRVTPVAFTMTAALVVVAPFAVLASLGFVGAGTDHVTRHADGQLPMTIAAIATAALLAVGALAGRRWISGHLTRTVEEPATADLVFSDLPSAGALSVAVAGIGLLACLLPITPLIVPLGLVVMAGAAPTLLIIGIDARRHHDGAVVVWTLRPTQPVEVSSR
jgi:hypothetical protein